MKDEAHLPQLEKAPSGDGVAQDSRLHVGSEASARAFSGCPVRRWRAERSDSASQPQRGKAGSRKIRLPGPNTISASDSESESCANFLERAVLPTAKVTRNAWRTSQTLRPEPG